MIDAPPSTAYVAQAPQMTEAGAAALAARAIDAAKAQRIAIAVAVVDPGGHLIVFRRMDNVPFVSVDVAVGKARTAAAIGAPSALFETMINNGAPAMLSVPGLVPLGGGVPVLQVGAVAGALGISGGRGGQDADIAARAIAAFDAAASAR